MNPELAVPHGRSRTETRTYSIDRQRGRLLAARLGEELDRIRRVHRVRGLSGHDIDMYESDFRQMLWEGVMGEMTFAFYTQQDLNYGGLRGRLAAAVWRYEFVEEAPYDLPHVPPEDAVPLPAEQLYRLPFGIFVRLSEEVLGLPEALRKDRLRGLEAPWQPSRMTLIRVRPAEPQALFLARDAGIVRTAYEA